MLAVSNTQENILKVFVFSGKIDESSVGLTSYDLRKIGIPGRTFDINREFLEKHQLIKLTVKRKRGRKQYAKYYDITPLGFFSLLKLMDVKELIKKLETKHVSKFIPLVGDNWNQLKTMYGDYVVVFLKRSIDQVRLVPVRPYSKAMNWRETLKSKEMIEEIEIPFEDYEFSLKISLRHHTYTEDEKDFVKYEPKLYDYDNYDDYIDTIIDRITFVFYFNLLRINYDKSYRNNVILEMFDVYKINNSSVKQDSDLLFDRFVEEIGLWKTFKESERRILRIVNESSTLKEIMNRNFDHISSLFVEPDSLKKVISKINLV